MVMGRRPEVKKATAPAAAFAVAGLAAQLATALASVPFRKPWNGPAGLLHNVGMSVTRTVLRAFIGYTTSIPIEEFRSVEILIDGICRRALPPFLKPLGVTVTETELGGVPALVYRPRDGAAPDTILYLHGGGFIGTSPSMYATFTGWIAHETACRVVVPDYRLAPEFPYPASLLDAVAAYEAILNEGVPAERLFVAGDSGGGNLVTSLVVEARRRGMPAPTGLLLFSPELSLALDEPSIRENTHRDILPWNIPVRPYLRGLDPHDARVSSADADLRGFPPTFVAYGGDEMFRDPIRRFVERLENAGVDATAIEEPAMFHVFPILMPWLDASGRVYRAVGRFVRARLEAKSLAAEREQP
ncbi:MAG: alpha/beta hydrolase [Proteobacteria bacterium]|nr:MAG: alpha/beta hydrolase [Pseudomonadota bacterium]